MLKLNWLETLGDRNPQLLRELKGRLKPCNLVLAGAISLFGQLLLFITFLGRLPKGTLDKPTEFPNSDSYCTGLITYGNDRKCVVDGLGNLVVDWQKWSLYLFLLLSVIGIFALLVAGTYLLIDNLAQEERKGTLNFIRLSPRSPQNILWGKILGVPILPYIVALLAVPLHLWTGLAANIPFIQILIFYGVLGMSCVFFYSFSLLFCLLNYSQLNRFPALFGSGVVFLLILVSLHKPFLRDTSDWLNVFFPSSILQYLAVSTDAKGTIGFSHLGIQNLQWFNLPVGMSLVGVATILTLNYSVWTYWTWQALQRRFLSPTKTIVSKRQSYLLVACFEIMALGFTVHGEPSGLIYHFHLLLACNFLVFFGLIVALTPQRQALLDWARYRKQKPSRRKGLISLSLLRDLVIGERSPIIVAIALNLAITAIILIPWIILGMDNRDKLSVLITLVLSSSLILMCAAISQLVALTQTKQEEVLIIGVLLTVIILAPLMIGLVSINSVQAPTLLLFTVFAFVAIKKAGAFSIFLALLGQLSVLALCSWQISRQLKKAGASNSIGLFAPPKALLP
jgi:hypothetical protein